MHDNDVVKNLLRANLHQKQYVDQVRTDKKQPKTKPVLPTAIRIHTQEEYWDFAKCLPKHLLG